MFKISMVSGQQRAVSSATTTRSNMAMCKIFEEDEVSTVKCDGLLRCGIVLESSEYLSSDDDTNDEDDELQTKVKKGTVRVAWHPDGDVEVLEEKNLVLADRSLMPGESVRRLVEGQDSQRGYVSHTRCRCHVQVLGKNVIICDIPASDLKPLNAYELDPGDVCLDMWVGKIERISDKVTVQLADGARCEVLDEDLSTFEDVLDKRDPVSEFAVTCYYPGQMLRGEFGCLEKATWLKSTINHSAQAVRKSRLKRITLTVESVATNSVEVHWMCRGYADTTPITTQLLEPPSKIINGENLAGLKRLDCFESSGFQLGHKAYYVLKESDVILERKNHAKHNYSLLHSRGLLPSSMSVNPKFVSSFAQTDASTGTITASVMTQNGCESTQCDAQTATSDGDALSADDESCHDTGEQITLEEDVHSPPPKPAIDAESCTESDSCPCPTRKHPIKYGVGVNGTRSHQKAQKKRFNKPARVKHALPNAVLPKAGEVLPVEVIFTQTVADVMWQDGTLEVAIPSNDLHPIHHLDELEFFPGDFVVSLTDSRYDNKSGVYGVVQSVQHTGRTCQVVWLKPSLTELEDELLEVCEVSVYDIKEHPDIKYHLGHVVVRVGGYKDSATDNITTPENGAVANQTASGVGQVYELGTDGHVTVEWSDGNRSKCHPHQLYLVSDEMSDYDDLWSGDEEDESETESSRSSCEWETEDEEQIPENGDENAITLDFSGVEANSNVPASDLEAFVFTLKCAVSNLEETVRNRRQDEVPGSIVSLCRPIFKIYRTYRELDRQWSTSFFSDDILSTVISDIRAELRKDRTAFMNKQVLELLENNRRRHRSNGNAESNLESQSGRSLSQQNQDSKNLNPQSVSLEPTAASHPEVLQDSSHISSCLEDLSSEITSDQCQKRVSATNLDIVQHTTDKHQELQNEILHITRSLTEISRRLESTSVHDFNVDQSSAVECDKAVNETSSQSSSGLGWSSFGSSDGISVDVVNEEPLTNTEVPVKCSLSKVCLTQQLCHSACMRLGALLSDKKDEIIATLTKIPIELEFKIETRRGVMSSSEFMKLVDEGSKVSSSPKEICKAILSENSASAETDFENLVGSKVLKPNISVTVKPIKASCDEENTVDTVASDESVEMPACGISSMLDVPGPLAEYVPRGFTLNDAVSDSHHYKRSEHKPVDGRAFKNAVYKEFSLLQSCLPDGIFVKGYQDRMDLFSVMIQGPRRTPYEDGLFFFEVQLPNDYPNSPPVFFYVSFCSDRLNPNLYEDGKVCVSLLGTWSGKGTENWSSRSNLLQVLISIQGLILNPEPYYNEAGYEKQKGSQQGLENSRLYNEMAILKLVQSMIKMVKNPVNAFESEVMLHLTVYARRMIARLQYWLRAMPSAQGASIPLMVTNSQVSSPKTTPPNDIDMSAVHASVSESEPLVVGHPEPTANTANGGLHVGSTPTYVRSPCEPPVPDFPLLPLSRGFKLTLAKLLEQFSSVLDEVGIEQRVNFDGADLVAG